MQTEIYEEFSHWLDSLLENNDMPENTVAFNFNLYEESEEDSVCGIQLIAADRFDPKTATIGRAVRHGRQKRTFSA